MNALCKALQPKQAGKTKNEIIGSKLLHMKQDATSFPANCLAGAWHRRAAILMRAEGGRDMKNRILLSSRLTLAQSMAYSNWTSSDEAPIYHHH